MPPTTLLWIAIHPRLLITTLRSHPLPRRTVIMSGSCSSMHPYLLVAHWISALFNSSRPHIMHGIDPSRKYSPDKSHSDNDHRHNGLRDDVATFLGEIQPSFLRFPGGNNLYDPVTRKNAVLPQSWLSTGRVPLSAIAGSGTRLSAQSKTAQGDKVLSCLHILYFFTKSVPGDWGYPNTDALG